MNWYFKVLKQCLDFNGRARRTEYWMFTLLSALFSVIAHILDIMLGLTIDGTYGVFYFSYAIAMIIPTLAVAVRRLHDIGKSGWMLLIVLIPIVGAIWLFVLMVKDSDYGINKYGVDPKRETI